LDLTIAAIFLWKKRILGTAAQKKLLTVKVTENCREEPRENHFRNFSSSKLFTRLMGAIRNFDWTQ